MHTAGRFLERSIKQCLSKHPDSAHPRSLSESIPQQSQSSCIHPQKKTGSICSHKPEELILVSKPSLFGFQCNSNVYNSHGNCNIRPNKIMLCRICHMKSCGTLGPSTNFSRVHMLHQALEIFKMIPNIC